MSEPKLPWRIRDAYPYTPADLERMAAEAAQTKAPMQGTQEPALPMQGTQDLGMDTSANHYP